MTFSTAAALQRERFGGVELVARELEHVQLGGRVEQLERRLAEVAADARAAPGALRHAADQRGHGALAVGAGDAHHRRARRAREQFDVAEHRQAARARRVEEGAARGDAGRHHDRIGAVEQRWSRPPARTVISGASSRSAASPGGASRVSVTATAVPCARR